MPETHPDEHLPLPRAVLSRSTLTAADGTVLSVLTAVPGAGIARTAAPIVVAVHGFASSAASGWGRTGHLDALTRAGRAVVALDLRGHGESGKPHEALRYTLDAVLADIVAVTGAAPALVAHAGEGAERDAPIDLIGYSLGSRLSWTLACREMLPIRRMVLGGFDGRPLFEGLDAARLDRLAAGVPTNDRVALAALVTGLAGTGGMTTGGTLPSEPILVVAGTRDPLAARAEEFAAGLPHGAFLAIDGRNHISTVPSKDYRLRLTQFLE